MAQSATSPHAFATDLVTLTEASALFARTGHPVAKKTLKQWAVRHGVDVVGSPGQDDMASWSDLLEIHALEVDRRQAARP